MEGVTFTPVSQPQHRRPDPPLGNRVLRYLTITGMVAVIVIVLFAAVPLWAWVPTGGVALSGTVGRPGNPQPPVTVTTTQTVPVETIPPTAQVRRDGATQDCPLQGLVYVCGGR